MVHRTMTAKRKFIILKIVGVILDVVTVFGLTGLGVLLNFDKLWEGIDMNGFSSFGQWASLVFYRLGLYLLPGFILSFVVFDKRFKYISRLRIWLNWTLGFYLLANVIIRVFAIDLALKKEIFNSVDSVVMLVGYVITFITKEKVEFDSTGAIINPKEK